MDCIFCKIRDNVITSTKLYEDEHCFVIKDLSPMAPVHLLLISKEHLLNCEELSDKPQLAAHLFLVVKTVTTEQGLEKGYRVVTNKGENGGQSVGHLHLHILGGKQLSWPEL